MQYTIVIRVINIVIINFWLMDLNVITKLTFLRIVFII